MDYVTLAVALGAAIALVLHAYGKNHPWAEKAADAIDQVEDQLPKK